MKLIINGIEDKASYTGEILGDLLDDILENSTAKGNFFSMIRMNDQNLPLDYKDFHHTPVSQIETLETEISTLGEIFEKNIANAQEYLEKLIPGMQKAADLFRMGNEQEASKFFLNIIDGMEWFSEVVESIARAVDLKPETVMCAGESFAERQRRLMGLIQQMVEANGNSDWVLLADLLEYEIVPFYSDWVKLLPEICKKGDRKL